MNVSSVDVLNLTGEELRKEFKALSIERYRADQVHQWIYEKGVYDFDRMTNISVPLRETLKKNFKIGMPQIMEKQHYLMERCY